MDSSRRRSTDASFYRFSFITTLMTVTALFALRLPDRQPIFTSSAITMLVIQMAVVFGGLLYLRLPRHRLLGMPGIQLLLTILLFVFAALSSLWSAEPAVSASRALLIFMPILGMLILNLSHPRIAHSFSQIGQLIVILGTALALYGLVISLFGTATRSESGPLQVLQFGPLAIAQPIQGIPPYLRIASLGGNPNGLALWMMLSIPMTAWLFQVRRGRMQRILLFSAAILQIGALLLTYSRAGIGGTALAMIIFFVVSTRSLTNRLILLITSSAILIVVVATAFTPLLIGEENAATTRLSLNLNERDHVWNALLHAISVAPIQGWGFGTSTETILIPAGIHESGHNSHLQLLAEIGLLGYAIFVALVTVTCTVVGAALRRYRNLIGVNPQSENVRHTRLILALCFASVISILTYHLFEGSLLRYNFVTLYWFYLLSTGMLLAMHRRPVNRQTFHAEAYRAESAV